MIRHLFKLIWNKKGAHSLLIIEIWASFLVLFGVLAMIIFNLKNYLRPLGFQYENVWNIELSANQDTVAVGEKLERVLKRVRSYQEVQLASQSSGNTPFSANQIGNSVSYKNISTGGDFYYTDDQFARTIAMPLTLGRWFSHTDRASKYQPVVINKALQEKLFENENPLGKLVKVSDNATVQVVGVVDIYKSRGEFMSDIPAVFQMVGEKDPWNSNILVRTRPGTDANFEARMVREIAAMVPGWGIEVGYLKESKANRVKFTVIPVVIFLVICGFLLVNVALGLFGILNLNIARRKSEIGLRRAMGATEGKVTGQFLGEIWVLATFSLLLGLIFAIQFPIMNVFDLNSDIYIMAIGAAIVVIYLIVTLCAWFPSRQASRIHPATALHEE
ncbi:ABC transporter permease [Dyadobacter sandarakinus]|uniref:ABC transporter permease n=1 Tax=Dyadobacter sandarakinus TaxID=2747268 RepID=A0ABX7I6Y7_9BACT|nr:ABC transporter permease [Dyadobacter sandarakinus]QRR01242.1 ABC transporter permease [Dyadobacter sandarakinus]